MHSTSPVPADDIADTALRALAYPIGASLESASKLLQTQVFSRKGIWPRSTKDVLPLPPKESLGTLLVWVDRAEKSRRWTQISSAFYTFYLVLTVCRPELMPELFAHDARHLCIDVMARQLDAAASDMRNGVTSESPFERIASAVDILRVIGLGVGSRADDWVIFARGSELRLIRALEAAWNCIDDTTHHDLKQLIMALQYGLSILTAGDGLSRPVLTEYQAATARDNAYTVLYQNLRKIHFSVECSDRECKKHSRDVEGGRLQKCGSCRLVRYCSRECQKRHWSAKCLPHKLACPAIKDILAFAPLTLDSDAFEAACRTSPHPQDFFETFSFSLLATMVRSSTRRGRNGC
ncbi:hypothetical protein EXIGLDRAFT_728436 [Exidia glandulosa HHB12029]|uniref:MYND-type domain-containing protein n=1 Tax=Exidia glandulosa HHB12029 TaxID=1314781 RepID=A0A165CX74_EXIGL|nr:hypothetical protein EXIGLDRAFT_728436 [Exidia glandulosa HHB12029]